MTAIMQKTLLPTDIDMYVDKIFQPINAAQNNASVQFHIATVVDYSEWAASERAKVLEIYQTLCEKYKEGVQALSGDTDQLEKLQRCAKRKGIVGYDNMDELLTKFKAQAKKDVFHYQLPE
jgi:hypothetical protein